MSGAAVVGRGSSTFNAWRRASGRKAQRHSKSGPSGPPDSRKGSWKFAGSPSSLKPASAIIAPIRLAKPASAVRVAVNSSFVTAMKDRPLTPSQDGSKFPATVFGAPMDGEPISGMLDKVQRSPSPDADIPLRTASAFLTMERTPST